MVSLKLIPVFAGLLAFVSAQSDIKFIDYNVIKLLNETDRMGVMVDNFTFPLNYDSSKSTVLYTGKAPVAQNGYRYVKINKSDNSTEAESFLRQPVLVNTVNEFFNRTWNTKNITKLPTIYEPLSAIHRIKSDDFHRDGEIPTMHIVANQTEVDLMNHSNQTEDIKIKSNMTYINLNDTLNYQDVEISLAGRSSRWLPKLSYTVKLNKKDRLYQQRRVKLRALDTDPSYIREQLAYDVVKSVGLLSSEFSYVRVFMNNQELGLFGIIEAFQNPWLANSFADGSKKYDNGNLYQGVYSSPASSKMNQTSDLSYMKNLTAYNNGQYKIKADASKKKAPNYKPLQKFTKFISTAPTNSSDAVKVWKKKLDVDSFLRSMALEVLLGYADGYISMADNYYVYDNPKTKQMFYIPSDMDLTFGSTFFKLDDMWSGNYSTFPGFHTRPLMTKILQVPAFKQQYEDLLVNITKNLVNPVVMNDRINNLVDMLQEDVAWDQELTRVAKNLFAALGDLSQGTSDNSDIANAVGSIAPIGMDMETLMDFPKRLNASIPFDAAVNGPTGYISLAGVKEWIQKSSNNTMNFYHTQ